LKQGWRVKHLGQRSPRPAAPLPPPPNRSIRRVVIFGAGGALAAALARELRCDYTLRLTDLRSLAEVAAANQPQSMGAPLPEVPPSPHECRVVDLTHPAEVLEACAGMDAIVNCAVKRREPAAAFRVNALGAYNVMCAAVAHGIRRVVHTGPCLFGRLDAAGYEWDTCVVEDAPPRPGGYWDLYSRSKLLGQEICRIFAGQYGLEVPALLFGSLVHPAHPRSNVNANLLVSWQDAARALRAALEVPGLPSPFEAMHINADLPSGVYPNDKAKRLLGWQPRDDLRGQWQKKLPG
jgi:nucleoside-diphosphate-sugar epimerase